MDYMSKKIYADFGHKIKELRKENNFTQNDIAKMLNVTQSTIVAIEKGQRKISIDFLNDFSRIFNVSIDELLNFENDEPLTQADFDDFTAETLEEIQSVEGFTAKNIQPIKDCNFSVAQFVQHTQTPAVPTTAQNVQHTGYSTKSTEQDGHIQRNITIEKEQINNNKEISIVNNSVNNSVDNNLIYRSFIRDSFYEHGNGLFNKSEVEYFADLILSEIVATPDSPQQYFNSIVETIAHRRKIKLGIAKTETPFYNWLEA